MAWYSNLCKLFHVAVFAWLRNAQNYYRLENKKEGVKIESLALLQQLQSLVKDSKSLGPADEDLVKSTFRKILESGDTYSVSELENWFVNQPNT